MDTIPQSPDARAADVPRAAAGAHTMTAEQAAAARLRVNALDAQIRALAYEKALLDRDLRLHDSPLKPGDRIKWRYGCAYDGKSRRGIVKSIHGGDGRFTYTAQLIRADGTAGMLVKIYSWDTPALDDGKGFFAGKK